MCAKFISLHGGDPREWTYTKTGDEEESRHHWNSEAEVFFYPKESKLIEVSVPGISSAHDFYAACEPDVFRLDVAIAIGGAPWQAGKLEAYSKLSKYVSHKPDNSPPCSVVISNGRIIENSVDMGWLSVTRTKEIVESLENALLVYKALLFDIERASK